MPYFTHLSNGSLVPVHEISQIKWMRSLVPRPPSSFSQSWQRGSWCEHVFWVHICPVSTISKWLTILKWWTISMLNRKELKMQRSELPWSLSDTHTLLYFRLPCHWRVQQLFKPSKCADLKFFTGLTNWKVTNWLTDGQKRLLNPFAYECTGWLCNVLMAISQLFTRHTC